MSLGIRLLIIICPALIPPKDPEERDYYEILGLSPNCSDDDIKKAYKRLSLQLHPDKVAQRGEVDPKEAAAEYELVQQAYAVLADAQQRQLYHATGRSPVRFKFLTTGGGTNPVALYENLAHASIGDKTRLVLLLAVLICIVLLQPILIASKVNAVAKHQACRDAAAAVEDNTNCDDDDEHALLDTPWTVLLIPYWIVHACIVLFWTALTLMVPPQARSKMLTTCVEQTLWFVGFILLAQTWDQGGGDGDDTNWHLLSIPFYLALTLQIYNASAARSKLLAEQRRMVSLDFLQAQEREALTEERLVELAEDYIIVTVDAETVAATVQVLESSEEEPLTAEDIEVIRVQSSAEYEINQHIVKAMQYQIVVTIFVAIPFVALVASRLEEQITCSWWIVFLPIWIYFGGQVVGSCMGCCCAVVPDQEEVILMEMDEEGEGETQEEKDTPEEDAKETDENQETPPENGKEEEMPSPAAKDLTKDTSVNWAKPDGDIRELDKAQNVPSADPKLPVALENVDETEEEGGDDEKPDGNEKDKEEGEQKEEDPHFEFDEEAFHAWQSAYAQAEEGAMEKRAKAQTTCCLASFQLTIICLIVGKLDQDFGNTDGVSDAGYNAFWILFPIFFVAFVLLCCCSCLIYGSGAEGLDDLVDLARSHDEEEGMNETADPETQEVTPDAEVGHQVDHEEAAFTEESKEEPKAPRTEQAAETEDDINDLD